MRQCSARLRNCHICQSPAIARARRLSSTTIVRGCACMAVATCPTARRSTGYSPASLRGSAAHWRLRQMNLLLQVRDGDLRAADAIDEQLTSEQSGVRRWYEAVGLVRATREPWAPAVRFRGSAAVGALVAIVQGHPALQRSPAQGTFTFGTLRPERSSLDEVVDHFPDVICARRPCTLSAGSSRSKSAPSPTCSSMTPRCCRSGSLVEPESSHRLPPRMNDERERVDGVGRGTNHPKQPDQRVTVHAPSYWIFTAPPRHQLV